MYNSKTLCSVKCTWPKKLSGNDWINYISKSYCRSDFNPSRIYCRWNNVHPARAAFLKQWSVDHKWSSGSALVVLLDWTLVQKRQKNKINVNCVSHTIVENLRVWKLHTTSVFKLSLQGLIFYEIYYPTYSTLNNKRGIFCCKNMFRTLFRAGLMSLKIPRVGWSVEHSD